jgi:hypothetical protein
LWVGRVQERVGDGEKSDLQAGGQKASATHADAAQVRGVADEEERMDFGMRGEPAGQGGNLRERAKAAWLDMLHTALLALKEDKVVALSRGSVLGQFQEIQGRRKGHLGKAADFEAAHAEQESWGESFAKKLKGVVFAAHVAGEDKNEVRRADGVSRREPGMQPRQQRA